MTDKGDITTLQQLRALEGDTLLVNLTDDFLGSGCTLSAYEWLQDYDEDGPAATDPLPPLTITLTGAEVRAARARQERSTHQ